MLSVDPRLHQGHFGEQFIRVLAAAAGMVISRPEPDVTGHDYTLEYTGQIDNVRHPPIQFQVKSWRQAAAHRREHHWKYRMEAKHFNELAGGVVGIPRFLALVIVPDDAREYATNQDAGVLLRQRAYWATLADRPQVPDDGSKVPVDIPVRNVLGADTLLELVERSVREEVR